MFGIEGEVTFQRKDMSYVVGKENYLTKIPSILGRRKEECTCGQKLCACLVLAYVRGNWGFIRDQYAPLFISVRCSFQKKGKFTFTLHFHYCLNIWWPSGSSEETRTGKIIARISASVLKSLIWVWCCNEKLAPSGTSSIRINWIFWNKLKASFVFI